MSFEDLPLFSTLIKIIKFWSLIVDNNWRRYAAIVPSVLVDAGQIMDIFLSHEPLDAIIRDAYFVALWSNTLIRAALLLYKQNQYVTFLKDVAAACSYIQRHESLETNIMLADTCKSATKLAKGNLVIGTLASVGILIYPLLTGGARALPYGAYIPGVDKYSTPWYEIIYVFQILVTIPGCFIYIPFTNLVVAFIMFGITMSKILKNHLLKLKDLESKDVWPEVVWCIQYQLQIIRYVKLINSLTTYMYLVEFLTFGALLCALLFLLNMVSSFGQVLIVVSYMVLILAQISAMYWLANELYCETLDVANTAYCSNWFAFDLQTQKAILLIIARGQQPCAILVGNIYPMNLELLQLLLNATYKYFTMLRRFMN